MLLDLIKGENIKYCYMKNGLIQDSNINLKDFSFNKDYKFVLFHEIDNDTEIEYNLNSGINVNILEIMDVKNNANIKKVFNISDNSNLDIVSLETSSDVNTSINSNSYLGVNAHMDYMKLTIFNGDTVIKDNSYLNNNKGKLNNYAVYINSMKKNLDIDSVVTHDSLDSESIMTNYAICKDTSKIRINTNGIIKKGAKGTLVRQKSKGILLDLESQIEANPWLQIDEYDCMASHGAGIGAIDEEELYYLMSRGLTKDTSEKLIIGGFVNPVYEHIEEMGFNKLLDFLKEEVDKYL